MESAEQTLSAGILQCEWAGYQRYLAFSHVSAARLKFAQDDLPRSARSLHTAEGIAAVSGRELLRARVRQFRVRLLKQEITAWQENCKLILDDTGTFQREDQLLTLARRARSSPDLWAVCRLMSDC